MQAMDFEAVTALLQTAYWCRGIAKKDVLLCAQNSALVVGAFDSGGVQVGFARVVSDRMRFAYVMDVIVAEEFRCRGIASSMMDFILKRSELCNVTHWLLSTQDAQPLYEKSGFQGLQAPEIMMELWKKKLPD